MTIDEAINILKSDNDYNKSIGCDTSYEEQVAEWLEELKAYKSDDFTKNLQTLVYKQGYNKAIDDFVKLVHKHDWNIRNINENSFIYGAIDTLAEQLKVGAGIGTDNQ